MLTILDLLVVLAIGVFFYVTGYRPLWWSVSNCDSKTKSLNDIPGPFALPILGTRWVHTWLGGCRLDQLHQWYEKMFAKYGSIVCERALWNIPVVSVRRRSDIETVLRQNPRYPVRPPTEVISHYRLSRPDRYVSVGLVNEQGERWHQLHSALTPALMSTKIMAQFVPELSAIVEDFAALLRHERDQNDIIHSLEALTVRMGLESTCALVLGRRMGFLLDATDDTATRLANAVQDHFQASRDTFFGLPYWKVWPVEAYVRLTQSEDTIYSIVSQMVDEVQVDYHDMDGVFSSVVHAPDIDVREKKATLIDFIAAGIHTLGNTLVFLFYLLGCNPTAQHRLHTEVSSSAANADLSKLPYLRACIAECFRMFPTASCLARMLSADAQLSGYTIPAGTVVLCHTGLACRDSSYFPHATRFIPERWLDERAAVTNNVARHLVVPFGIGRRICPGKRFVEHVLQLTVAKIVGQFEVLVDKVDRPLKLKFEFLLAPQGPVRITLVNRVS